MPDLNAGAEERRPDAAGGSLREKRPRLAGLIVGAVALAGVIAFALHVGDIGEFAQTIVETDPRWLAPALTAQAFAFLTQALVWALVLARRKSAVKRGDLFILSIGKLFADQAVPSAGVSGAVFFVHALTRRGVSAADAFVTFIFGASSFIVTFILFAVAALAFVAFSGGPVEELAVNVSDVYYIAIASILLLFIIGALMLASQGKNSLRPGALATASENVRRAASLIYEERGLFAVCLGLQALARLLDGVTLWIAFQALGGGVPFITSIVAISLAALAATVAPTPMGLGSFEAGLLTALASQGHGVEASFAGLVIYRGLSLGLPLALGFFIVQRELLRR